MPGNFDKYDYLSGEEILPSDQSRVIEQANFTHSPLGKALGKRQERLNINNKNK